MNLTMEENKKLKQQYSKFTDHLNKIETNYLSNNAIITGVPEQSWKSNDGTKQQVHDVMASAI